MAEQSGDDDNRIDLDRTHAAALNLAVLQRIDPATVSIVATANHVAIYAFNTASQQWAKRNVEGACFVVERSEESKARWHAVGTPDDVHASSAGMGLRSIASSS